MATGYLEVGSISYYFDENGVMQTGWVNTDIGEWAYFRPDGSQVKGSFVYGYYIDENGYYYDDSELDDYDED